MERPAHKPANFNLVAALYRPAEYLLLGRTLKRTREFFLPALTGRRRTLVIGDGDGRFLAKLLQAVPQMRATAMDGSGAMLRLLEERCRRTIGPDQFGERLETVAADALAWTASPPERPAYDLLVTHFMLDCLTEAEVGLLAVQLAAYAKPRCLWLVSDFAVPRRRGLRRLGRLYIRLLYLAFRILTGLRVTRLPDIHQALCRAGFRERKRREFLAGLLFTSLWELAPGTQPGLAEAPSTPDMDTEAPFPGDNNPDTETTAHVKDALPDPEPIAPSLCGPDRGVYPAAEPDDETVR